jgi:hypothetical protein
LVKVVADPRLPTEKEIEKHCPTHLPYRNWCSVCVVGKGKDLDHRKCVRLDFFAECGFRTGDILIKSDQEPAIKLLVKDLAAERGSEPGHKTLVEESPVQSSGSNGVVERAVQGVAGQVRLGGEDRSEGAGIALYCDVFLPNMQRIF